MGARVSALESHDPMTRLQDCWYNAVAGQINLARDTFQLSQPSPLIAPTDAGLWSYQNAIPPLSLTFNREVSGGSRFFDAYAAIARHIQFPLGSISQEIGEDNYQAWLAYLLKQNPPPPAHEIPGVFNAWASVYASSVAAAGTAALSRTLLIDDARRALEAYDGPDAKQPDFHGGYSELLQTMERASGARVSFDSRSADCNAGDTWAGGRNVGLYGLWSGSSKDSPLSQTFGSSHVRAEVRFKAVVVWVSTPGAWYNSSLLHTAYADAGGPLWAEAPGPAWLEVFGENGRLSRCLSSLFVVDGIEAEIISYATYDEPDRSAIVENAPAGLWPLYVPDDAAARNQASFDAHRGMMIRTVTIPRHPVVLGGNVLGIGRYLGQGRA